MSDPKADVPTAEEIRRLPRWAQVAFAARCARRVLPVFLRDWPAAPAHHASAVVRAVDAAELSAAAATAAGDAATRALDADAASSSATRSCCTAAAYAAAAAARAAAAATAASYTAARAAAAARGAVLAQPGSREAILNDFRTLLARAAAENWTDDAPVPPTVFGPMWPDGPPPGWTDEAQPKHQAAPAAAANPQAARELIVRVLFRPGVTAKRIAHDLHKLYSALNEYHLAHGGSGLKADDFQALIRTAVPGVAS